MAESESSSSEQPKSRITCEVNLDTDEIEIKYKDNTTWSHITIWKCDVVTAICDLEIYNKLLHAAMRLKSSFDDDFHVAATSIRAMKKLLVFGIGYDTSDDAFQMATEFVEVKKTILNFIQEIDVNVTDISLRCWIGEQNGLSEQANRNTDESNTKGEPIWNPPSESKGHKSETNWFCSLEQDEFEIDLKSSDKTFTRLKRKFDNIYRCTLKRVLRGSLILECEHESQKDALDMVKDHVKVKATILKCLHEMDPRVIAIKVQVEYNESQKVGTATPTPARRDPRADSDIHDASREGNVAAVKRILAAGRADVNWRGVVRRTPVMRAARWGHRDVVELLVSEGADVSLVDEDGNNTLHYACWGGDVETVKFVLSLLVVDINSRVGRSQTTVMKAAWGGHRDVVEILVSEGADVSLVDDGGYNTLHWACWGGDVETVKFVLSLNVVDIDARNNLGRTAADMARRKGHQEVVKLL